MKTTRLFLCLALAVCSAAPAAELLWQDFDSAPTGSVAALPGWSRASWLGGLTGRVFNVDASHPPFNTLELVWNVIGSSAVFTNFNSAFNPANEHPVIRCSAKLHCSNTNAFFQLGLRDSKTGNLLSFQSTNGYGCFGFIHRDKFFAPSSPTASSTSPSSTTAATTSTAAISTSPTASPGPPTTKASPPSPSSPSSSPPASTTPSRPPAPC